MVPGKEEPLGLDTIGPGSWSGRSCASSRCESGTNGECEPSALVRVTCWTGRDTARAEVMKSVGSWL